MMEVFDIYLQQDNTIDVMHKDRHSDDYDLFFGPVSEGAKPHTTGSKNIGEILFELKLVQSKNWARKNNWWKELETGYHEVIFGSRRIKLCILL
jgi:hypothetical protein